MKLAIVTTHPIQYNAPWFKLLSEQECVDIHVFYTWEQSQTTAKFDPGFGKTIEWDIPLLEGYEYSFVKNVAQDPGSHHYKGIDTPTLTNDIEAWGANAVLVFGWAFKGHLSCMKYFKGKIPVLFRGDSTLLDERGGLKIILRRLFLKYVYRNIDYALYVGTNNKDYFLSHGVKEKQLVFVPHAIDNKRFDSTYSSTKENAERLKDELGISDSDFVVLFAGKFNHKKNPRFILQLSERIKEANVKFLLVGNGDLESDLKQNNTDKRVLFLDFQNQKTMPAVYSLANVFVLPSNGPNETWGLAINEAVASGKYVVTTTKVGCAVDMVVDGVNGKVIEPGDVDSAFEFINTLLSLRDDREQKAINRKLLDVYSFKSLVANISNLLNKIKRETD